MSVVNPTHIQLYYLLFFCSHPIIVLMNRCGPEMELTAAKSSQNLEVPLSVCWKGTFKVDSRGSTWKE